MVRATTNGVRQLRRIERASIVWGWKPSLISTTTIAMSASAPPRARSVVNAWWPGVSMKSRPGTWTASFCMPADIPRIASIGTRVAPMCCVMAPASLETTEDPRILSRREVLPWSTCPSTQTMGVRMPPVANVVASRIGAGEEKRRQPGL